MINLEFIDCNHDIDLKTLDLWLRKVVLNESKKLGVLTIVIGSDEWLRDINVKYLNHDYYTDIITFDYTEEEVISGDLLISLDRVYDNSKELNVSRETELNRVIVHGVLHLLGYNDKSLEESELMRKKEDYYLSLL